MRCSSPSRRLNGSARPASHAARDAVVRNGFTLIELAIVILVVLILATLTFAMVGNVMDGDRVRGASRQVQNYLAGARDRAIYAASRQESSTAIPPAVGVRFLPDPALIQAGVSRGFGSMVFVQEVEPLTTRLFLEEDISTTPPIWKARQKYDLGSGPQYVEDLNYRDIRSLGALIKRGLVDSRMKAGSRVYYLPVYFDRDGSQTPYYVEFLETDLDADGWLVEGQLSKSFPFGSSSGSVVECRFRLLPSPMPNEEPRILPSGTVVDVGSSVVGGAPSGSSSSTLVFSISDLLRDDGSFDIMFNARGVVEGPLASTGLVHFVVADASDVEQGFRIWSNFADIAPQDNVPDDTDGDGTPEERRGDEAIISVRTQTGSIYSSNVNPVPNAVGTGRLDPFLYAETGGEAK